MSDRDSAPALVTRRTLGKAALVLSGGALASALGGCSASPTASPTGSAPTTTASPTPAPTPTPTAYVPRVAGIAGLTPGPVLAVKIDHTRAAVPRVGLASADVVYVEPVEAGLTRLLAVFSSAMPAKVGPVRSTRESDVDLLANYGPVAFAFSGGSDYTLGLVRAGKQKNVSFDDDPTGYVRDPRRPKPYDVIGSTDVLLRRGGGSVPPFDVGLLPGAAPTGGAPGVTVTTSWQASTLTASYVAPKQRYAIAAEGRTETDALDGRQVLAANVIVQVVESHLGANKDVNGVPTPVINVIGGGKALMLREGRSWSGTWARPDAISPTTFTTQDGQPFQLVSGQTWILLVPAGQAFTVA